ncbi:hypothetical protein CspeluHIS016_0403480 [Cutaneotrichosporon spelunceum]|uniref:2',3'-cyclic-nucleotide 3'-phosphodiesterase n=1 Tax=Cutaneotrichosporon spelunceum TaxID=1672016 RepID=A0AAD3TVY2_9TREE|nr:hypothetical protein CspeluHIS016_0403480 [Cutaneotrichosporon spelunceum]
MFDTLKADIAIKRQEKLEKKAPAGPHDEPFALRGFSLWLLPPLEAGKTLSDTIYKLASKAGSPAFMPHITLFTPRNPANMNANKLEKALHRGINASMLARDMDSEAPLLRSGDRGLRNKNDDAHDRPFEAAEPGLDVRLLRPTTGAHYYQCVFAPLDPTATPGLAALRGAVANYLGEPAEPYFPHLSLCYGDFDDAKKREVLANVGGDWPMDFTCTEAVVVDTNGTADKWRIVTAIRLT